MSETEKPVVKHEVEICDNTFYIVVWTLVATMVLTLILSIMSYNKHSRDAIVEMTNNGTPAMEASCAIEGFSDSNCVILNTSNAVAANSRR